MLLFNGRKQLFLGERFGEPGNWQLPQGGVEPESSIEDNVRRELSEELGVEFSSLRIVKQLEATHDYDFARVPPYAVGKWRGQAQTFWLVEFLGDDSEICLDRHEQEFSAWKWCSLDEVRQCAEPKRLPGYLKPLKEFEIFIASAA